MSQDKVLGGFHSYGNGFAILKARLESPSANCCHGGFVQSHAKPVQQLHIADCAVVFYNDP